MLTGLRGVGKTVLLTELRSTAARVGWGAGKLEARPDTDLRRPLAAALHRAIRDLGGPPAPGPGGRVLAVLKAFALEAETELAVGFFGSRYERATPAEREYLRAIGRDRGGARRGHPDVIGGRTPGAQTVLAVPGAGQPAEEGPGALRGERGQIAFTVPHFDRYLLTQDQ